MTRPDVAGRKGHRWRTARQECFRRWGTDCWWCGHPDAHEVDHLDELFRGGDPYDPDNLRPSHGSNAPCPVCRTPEGNPRCCNQERNRRPRPQRVELTIDATTL